MKHYHYISVPDHICAKREYIANKVNTFKMACPECNGELVFHKELMPAILTCSNAPYCEVTMPINQAMLIDIIKSVLDGKPIQMIQDVVIN